VTVELWFLVGREALVQAVEIALMKSRMLFSSRWLSMRPLDLRAVPPPS